MRPHLLREALEWVSVSAILLAYGAVTLGFTTVHALPYQLANILGALCIAVASLKKRDYQPAAANIVWGCITLIALTRSLWP